MNYNEWIDIQVNIARTKYGVDMQIDKSFSVPDILSDPYTGPENPDFENLMNKFF